MKMTSIV